MRKNVNFDCAKSKKKLYFGKNEISKKTENVCFQGMQNAEFFRIKVLPIN